ncbi:n-acetyltransferase domain-containing protein [Nephila pilipes]|uniref:N-acetyltransferase domain-containing protein n=1 Tax=Nephila pilipes TaxID=299642 RepID=A0A8X6QPL5_NEPPI|nr:n-acetyltransferase domain-containing protein [Nephila pilipes]
MLPGNVEIEPFQPCLSPSMIQYDASVAGYRRKKLLELSCQERDSRIIAAFRNGICTGFRSIKITCLGVARVGPLYADDSIVAEALLKNFLESFPNRKRLAMTTLNSNIPANTISRKLGNAETDICLRIYSKQKTEVNAGRIYAFLDVSFSAI